MEKICDTLLFLESNDTISALLLSQEERNEIGNENIMFLEDNLSSNNLKIFLNYLKDIPQQGNKLTELLCKIGENDTAFLINNLSQPMMITLMIHINIHMMYKIFIKYSEEDIIETINKFNYNNISSEGQNHVLIKALNKGQLPGYIDQLTNIYRRTKRVFNGIINNSTQN